MDIQIFLKTGKNNSIKCRCFDSGQFDELMSPGGLLTNAISTAAEKSIQEPMHESQIGTVFKTLRLIIEEKNASILKSFLKKPPHKITIEDVIYGLKQLEYIINKHKNIKRKDQVSMSFRWFLNCFGGSILDEITVSECGFRSQLTKREMPIDITIHNVTSTSPLFIFKTKKNKYKIEKTTYVTIEPDRLDGLVVPDSILDISLKNASKSSKSLADDYSTISSVYVMLKMIAKEKKEKDIRSLLCKPPNKISELEVQNGFIQLENIVQEQGKGILKASRLRTFLNKWGGQLLNGKTIIHSGFKSRFVNQGKTLACIKPIFVSVEKSDKGIKSIEKYCINTYRFVSLAPPKSLLAEALFNAKALSKNKPITMKCIERLEQLLLIISSKKNWKLKKLLVSEPKNISSDDIHHGFNTLEKIIKNNFSPKDQLIQSRNFRNFLRNYSEISSNNKIIKQFKFRTKFSKKTMSINPLLFKTKTKMNGIYTYHEKILNLVEIDSLYTDNSLLGISLQTAAQSSLSEPVFSSRIHSIWSTLKLIEKEGTINLRTLLITPPSLITKEQLVKSFQDLERIINKKNWNDKGSVSNLIRGFLSQWGGKISNNLTINQCRFKSRFKKHIYDKKLIEPLDKNGDIKPSPIVTPHKSLFELRKNISGYYEEAIQQILDACSEEIARYKALCNEVSPLIETESRNFSYFSYKVPEEVSDYTDCFTIKNRDATFAKTKTLINKYGVNIVLASALQKRLKTPLTSYFQFPGQSFCIPYYVETWFPKSGMTNDFIWCGTLLPRQVLLVCFIRIVIFTTWNKDVVATLTPDDLPTELPDNPFVIQGNKNKVDKHTPEVTVHPHDHDIREVINYLIFHVRNLRNLGHNPQTIWETIQSVHLTFLSSEFIKRFCERSANPTPYFTLEQLAKHQINLRYKIDSNLEKSRQERNHSKVKTTAGYMATPLAKIEYEANNAEFQRRLETTVQFLHAGEKSLISYSMDPRDIDHKLLASPDSDDEENASFLLGDGSSCRNIWAPVDKHNLDQDICRGRKCHKDGGCVYNEIIISPYEFSFTLRKRQWFIPRCDLLLDKHGREYFDTYIAPEMIFVFGLTRYVEMVNPALYREAMNLLTPEEEARL